MKITPLHVPEVLLVEPVVHRDGRGFFVETWQRERYLAAGIGPELIQDNHSRSVQGTLRGLHAQLRRPQGKLVRVVVGTIWDVAVDHRPGSPTFGRFAAAELSADNFRQLWIPPGFLHGFCVLSDTAEVEYKVSAPYDRADEIGVRWDDPALRLPWPTRAPLLSDKDRALPLLSELLPRLRAP